MPQSSARELELPGLAPEAGTGIVITGGCGGIGMALVQACVALDMQVTVLDLEESISSRTLPEGVRTIAFDIRDEISVVSAFSEASDGPTAHSYVVNLPGFTDRLNKIEDLEIELFDALVAANLRGMVLCCRESVRLLRRSGGGAIVNMSSGIANIGNAGYAGYAASKAGINVLTRTMATEAAPEIRVNAVAPGGIDTAFLRGGFGRGGKEDGPPERVDVERYAAMVPLGRIGQADDVAGPVLFLLSDAARYITGQVLHVNGGALMRD